jgi:AcrR family transcriptional regulator
MNVPSSKRRAQATSRRSPAAASFDVRTAILDGALRAFAERGFHGTNVPEIAHAASVGIGTVYRQFESKEHLVNAVFRRAKGELRDALLFDLDFSRGGDDVFREVWSRLVRFHRERPLSFQFLETQDHVPYLDAESRHLERSLLEPLLGATEHLKPRGSGDLPAGVSIALVDATYARAGEACLRVLEAKATPKKPPDEDPHADRTRRRHRSPGR